MRARRAQGRAAQSTLDALLYALRSGLGALEDGRNLPRLGELDDAQMRECAIALQKRKPEIGPAWNPQQVATLMAIRAKLHGHQ